MLWLAVLGQGIIHSNTIKQSCPPAPPCPPAETLLLDLEAVVVLQNELQRLCLVAASLLVVQQVRGCPSGWKARGA